MKFFFFLHTFLIRLKQKKKEFKQQSNGMNSIFEIFSYACVMCQNDSFLIGEYKNSFIESSRTFLFVQNNVNSNQSNAMQTESSNSDNNLNSIYLQLLMYWTYILNDPKNTKLIFISYLHALNTLKTILLASGTFSQINIKLNYKMYIRIFIQSLII